VKISSSPRHENHEEKINRVLLMMIGIGFRSPSPIR
jgi:hypothetical protein